MVECEIREPPGKFGPLFKGTFRSDGAPAKAKDNEDKVAVEKDPEADSASSSQSGPG
jgi:hypothetical protein